MRNSLRIITRRQTKPIGLAGAAFAAGSTAFLVLQGKQDTQQQPPEENFEIATMSSERQHSFLENFALHYKSSRRKSLCEDDLGPPLDGGEVSQSDGYTEAERFEQCVAYHRTLYFDYNRRWNNNAPEEATVPNPWPRRVPNEDQITSIEADYTFCRRGAAESKPCQDMEFRIACYYVQSGVLEERRRAWKRLKALAEAGHADAMCYYGMILKDGLEDVVEASSELSVVWLKRCMENHPLHIECNFEFAKAVYLGDGIPENLEVAVDIFHQMAHLGHAGAAYMLGECLLEGGVGVKRDRADALEWFVTAAELGHLGAQKRVLAVLSVDPSSDDDTQHGSEKAKWADRCRPTAPSCVTIERRHTLGPSPPAVIARRMTKLAESRGVSPPYSD